VSSSYSTHPREIVAQRAIEAARDGNLPLLDEYTLRYSSGAWRTTVPKLFCDNVGVENGTVAGVYADFERGLLVYDLHCDWDDAPDGGVDGE